MSSLARLCASTQRPSRLLIGLMSGMSMDGIDLALARISGAPPQLRVELLDHASFPYPAALRPRLVPGRLYSVDEVAALDALVADAFADAVLSFLTSRRLAATDIDAVGSHGQTLFHATTPETAQAIPATLQVGAPSRIAERCGIPTIGNFRARDLAAGGQGAPLVAFADYVLHRDADTHAVVNLGSIANVTIVTPSLEDVVAFDLGPANMPIDFYARRAAQDIDRGGSLSARGQVISELLAAMLAAPFFALRPPRAAGYREFGPERLEAWAATYAARPAEDLARTAVEFSAASLARAFRELVLPAHPTLKKVTVSGGGVRNPTLMRRIAALLPELVVEPLAEELAVAKEALAFAILANETLSGRPSNVPRATGAKRAVVLGELAP